MPSLISVFESILARTKFENKFNLCDLVKYWPMMRNLVEIRLPNAKHFLKNVEYSYSFILPLRRVLLCLKDAEKSSSKQTNLMVLNKSGDLIKFRTLNGSNFIIKVNATNIFAYDKFAFTFEILNFDLELVHSFKLDSYYNSFYVSRYDLVFESRYFERLEIAGCSYKTNNVQPKKTRFEKSEFLEFCGLAEFDSNLKDFVLNVLGLNEKYIFVKGGFSNVNKALFLLDRSEENSLLMYFEFKASNFSFFVYKTRFYVNYYANMDKYRLQVYDTGSANDELCCVCDEMISRSENNTLFDFYTTSDHERIVTEDMAVNGYKQKVVRFRIY